MDNEKFLITTRIRISKEDLIIYGSGISELLQLTDKNKSLHASAKIMGMSYKKALLILKNAENGLGEKLLNKSIGGVGGGGSELTEFGHKFVYDFSQIEKEVFEYASKLITAYFTSL